MTHPSLSRPFLIALAALPLTASPLPATEPAPPPFPGLTVLAIDGSPSPQRICYDPAIAKVINRPLGEIKGDKDGLYDGMVRVLSTPLAKGGEPCDIDFDPGPSADPVFIISDDKSGKEIGKIAADSLAIPGNGFIYAAGRSNNMHLERQKFSVKDGTLAEIKQPFSYVGLDTKANVPLKLTAGKDGGETIANLPKGETLQVVIRDGEHLLIKTPFGLVGWWKMNPDVLADNAEIEGIYYAGD